MRRVFFALWPSAEFVEALCAGATPLLECVEGRRLGPDDWHVTVCFIGAVNEAVLAALQASAAQVAAAPFTLRFDRIEYWAEARLIAATASEVPTAALELSRALRELARSLGLSPDEKPLRPHLTLMRGVNPLAWQMNKDSASPGMAPELLFVPDALHLAESRPAPGAAGAPSYVRLASWPLAR